MFAVDIAAAYGISRQYQCSHHPSMTKNTTSPYKNHGPWTSVDEHAWTEPYNKRIDLRTLGRLKMKSPVINDPRGTSGGRSLITAGVHSPEHTSLCVGKLKTKIDDRVCARKTTHKAPLCR
jgi:hypothetical protein